MKKLVLLILIVILCPVLAGVYGILHDQFTYTISAEYYTKFKFYQFGLAEDVKGGEAIFQSPRLAVAAVGFMATWWTGILIGLGIGTTGLFQADAKTMFKSSIKAVVIAMALAAITGLIGLAYGGFYLANTKVDWWLPDNLIDKKSFIMVGSMHNFSYIGAVIGLLGGIVYQIITARRNNPDFKRSLSNLLYFGLKRPPKR
jgi:hypothetical protein